MFVIVGIFGGVVVIVVLLGVVLCINFRRRLRFFRIDNVLGNVYILMFCGFIYGLYFNCSYFVLLFFLILV